MIKVYLLLNCIILKYNWIQSLLHLEVQTTPVISIGKEKTKVLGLALLQWLRTTDHSLVRSHY